MINATISMVRLSTNIFKLRRGYILNLTKKEYITPNHIGDLPALMWFAFDRGGAMTALALLLAVNNNPDQFGELNFSSAETLEDAKLAQDYVIGRWGGDSIAILMDNYKWDDLPGVTDQEVPPWKSNEWIDITNIACWAMMMDRIVNSWRSKHLMTQDNRPIYDAFGMPRVRKKMAPDIPNVVLARDGTIIRRRWVE